MILTFHLSVTADLKFCSRLFGSSSFFSSSHLQLVTRGCEALEVTPLRDGVGQPGFLMNEEGFVTELQRFCYAESGGLQLWARVVRLCGHSLVHLSLEERTKLLRTAHKIHITVIPPDENGKPRRWVSLQSWRVRKKEGEHQRRHVWANRLEVENRHTVRLEKRLMGIKCDAESEV